MMAHVFSMVTGDECGQGLVEYALILSFVALAVVGALYVLGPATRALFEKALPGLE